MQEKTGYFDVLYSPEVERFLDQLNDKARKKIVYNIDKAKFTLDPRLFKKISNELWEFRTRYSNIQYRLFAFWDKADGNNTLVIVTHGIQKNSQKLPQTEIDRAIKFRTSYFNNLKQP